MSKNDVDLTVAGVVGSEVKIFHADDGGVPFAMFRMAHTSRVRDALGVWRDGETLWFTVKVFRQAARNAAQSLHSGDAVLVHGRLATEEWSNESGTHFGLVLTAQSLGHDLTRGTARFTRVTATRSAPQLQQGAAVGAVPSAGVPRDVTAFPEVDEDGVPVESDDDPGEDEDDAGEIEAVAAAIDGLGVGRPALVGAV